MNIFRNAAIAAVLCVVNFASFAENVESNVVASGSSSALNINAYIAPTSNFIGNNSKLYLAIVLGNAVYFYSDTAGFVQYAGGLAALTGPNPAEATPVRAITKSTETISLAGDATGVIGADVYVGYGTSFAELISSGRYAKKYTIVNGPVPLAVQATSYLNAKNLNIPAQKLPLFPNGVDPVKGAYSEYVATAIAYGDFFQTGQMSMLVVTSRPGIGNTWQLPGVIHFYKFDSNGYPVDNTSSVLPDTTGCLATRKLLVADFNGDGKPDVYLSCHGSEYNYPNWTGEKTRILLSQPNGTYTNTETALNCYCHGSAAADLNGDGKVDIITSDGLVSIASRSNNDSKPSSMVTMINDGTGHFTVVRDSNYQVVPAQTFTMTLANGSKFTPNETMYDMELVDVNGDGKADLIAASANDYTNAIPHSILLNNGNGTFSNYASFVTGIPNFWGLDIIVKNDNVYLYGVSIDNSISTAYAGFQYMAVSKFNLSSKSVSTVWNSNGRLWKNEVPTQPHDFNWMMPYNGNLVPLNAAYGVSIPMQ